MWHGPCSGFRAQATNEKVPCGARNAAKVLLIGAEMPSLGSRPSGARANRPAVRAGKSTQNPFSVRTTFRPTGRPLTRDSVTGVSSGDHDLFRRLIVIRRANYSIVVNMFVPAEPGSRESSAVRSPYGAHAALVSTTQHMRQRGRPTPSRRRPARMAQSF